MNKNNILIITASLLVACASDNSTENYEFESNVLTLEPVNGKSGLLSYTGLPSKFNRAKLTKNGEIFLFGKYIDISQSSRDNGISVDLGNQQSDDWYYNINSKYDFLSVGSVGNYYGGGCVLDSDGDADFTIGEITKQMPTTGVFEYHGIFESPVDSPYDTIDPSIYTVDFSRKKITANFPQWSEQYEADISGNTFKSAQPKIYNASLGGTNYQFKTEMAGAFFGPQAEEMGGYSFMQKRVSDNDEWSFRFTRGFAAKKQ